MPPIKSLAFKCLARRSKLVVVILLLNEIMPSYSCYAEKGLVYIIIAALFSQQPSSCSECIKSNIYLSCNVRSMSDTKCIYLTACLYTF
jgi:hypothetical protein